MRWSAVLSARLLVRNVILKCKLSDCAAKDTCYRVQAPDCGPWQMYTNFESTKMWSEDKCEFFIDVEDINDKRVRGNF